MRVPLSDPKRQYLSLADKIDAVVQSVMSGGWYIFGREHDAFEREFAAYCQRQHTVAVANGTDALEIALRALGCGRGDEVITVANAGGYTTMACVQLGVMPVYVDIEPTTLTMSPASVVQALSPRTKAVVVTHLYGMMADLAGICQAIDGRGIHIVEDCAQAHGAMRQGRRAGSFGDLAAFSFYPTKNLGAMGDGGAIVTEDGEIASRLRKLRQYGWEEKYKSVVPGGRNSRMDELQAAILRQKLPCLDRWNQQRRDIVARYHEATRETRLQLVHAAHSDFVAHLCIARHPDRDALRCRLEEKGVSTAIHYPILDHHQPSIQGMPWRAMELPATNSAQAEILTLPCFPEMTESEINYVCDMIRCVA